MEGGGRTSGNEQPTGGTVEAAAKPWLTKSAHPAVPFDTQVTGMEEAAKDVTHGGVTRSQDLPVIDEIRRRRPTSDFGDREGTEG